MPFKAKLRLNNGVIDKEDKVIFQSWINYVWGKYHSDNVRYAEILYNNSIAYLKTNCACNLLEKSNLKKGDIINQNTIIGYFEVDGEEFIAHYEMVGWVYGKCHHPIKSWKHAVVTWKKNHKAEEPKMRLVKRCNFCGSTNIDTKNKVCLACNNSIYKEIG